MTVYVMTGCPGSGKSLHLAQMLLHSLDSGHPVICNFEVNRDYLSDDALFLHLPNDELSPGKVEEFCAWYWSRSGAPEFREDYITLCIDEAQIILNSRSWDSKSRAAWIRFFTLHRKLGLRILISSQYVEMIDKQIRDSCIEYSIQHFKMNNFGFLGAFIDKLLRGRPLIRWGMKWYKKDTVSIETGTILGSPRLYGFYDTRKVFDSADVATACDSTGWFYPQLPAALREA